MPFLPQGRTVIVRRVGCPSETVKNVRYVSGTSIVNVWLDLEPIEVVCEDFRVRNYGALENNGVVIDVLEKKPTVEKPQWINGQQVESM